MSWAGGLCTVWASVPATDITVDDLAGAWSGLPAGLLHHMRSVSGLAGELATRWGADPHDAELAGFLHDVARAETPARLLTLAADLGVPVNPVEAEAPLLLHGPVGSLQALERHPWVTPDIAQAIRWHSTGRWGMGLLEKVVFLADKLEPGKSGHYQGLRGLSDLAHRDLNAAVLRYLDWLVNHLLERGQLVHTATLDAHNWLLLESRGTAPSPT
jgi:predicted HD superfamily hydrolase involved in NAD metabolism